MAKKKVGYKTKKRQFHGNRFSKQQEEKCISSSSKKLKLDTSHSVSPKPRLSPVLKKPASDPVGYRLVDLELLFQGLRSCLSCKNCNGKIVFSETDVKGLGSKIFVKCESCEPSLRGSFTTSKVIEGIGTGYEVNRRCVFAMRSIGQGLAGMKRFCGVMNMPPPVAKTTYNLINSKLLIATKEAANESMKQAVAEEVKQTEESETGVKTDITVSGDGTWMKRGHTSLHGVCTIIGMNTGKVLDVESLSSHCHICNSWKGPKTGIEYNKWLNEHKTSGKCGRNHFGSAGSMEVAGIKKMFLRSEAKLGVRFTNYIGDGDTATYPAICESQPYGPDINILKEECVGHVQKRMYSRLKTFKTKNKSKVLSDGKKIGGKNRLTDVAINQLCIYYGNAIRGNSNNLNDMRKAIWAIWNHKASTDEKPEHNFCPKGLDSWCPYQKAVASNTVSKYKHKNTIPLTIMEEIKPIFADLSHPNLLRRCLKGKTQNANESFNSVLWSICPKKGFVGSQIVEMAAYEASLIFNDGHRAKAKVFQHLNIAAGKYFEQAMENIDILRVRSAERKAASETQKARKARRMLKLQQEESFIEMEGVSYAAGEF